MTTAVAEAGPPGVRRRGNRRRPAPPYLIFITVLCSIALVAVSFVVTRGAHTSNQTLRVAVADSTYVVQEAPNTSFAGRQTVQAATLNDEHAIAYLKFVVPTFANQVSSVRLDLLTAAAAGGMLTLHSVGSNSWRAPETSFTHRPALGKVVAKTNGPSTVGELVSFDLSSVITKPGTYSFAVMSESRNAVFAAYGGSQGPHGPSLDIWYRDPDPHPGGSYAQGSQGPPPGNHPTGSPSSAAPSPSSSQVMSGAPVPTVSDGPSTPAGGQPEPTVVPTVTSSSGGGGGGGSPPVVPAGQALCGAYWLPPSGQSYMQSLATEENNIGTLDSIRVFNPGAPQAWPGNAGAVNRTVIVSFKINPNDINSGADDSMMRSWFANAPRDQNVYWTYWHEPEDEIAAGQFTAAAYRAAWQHLASLADQAKNPRLHATLILMQWSLVPASGRNWQDYYPGSNVIDVLGWDVYSLNGTKSYSTPASLLDPVIAASKSVGKPYGIAELGAELSTSDSSGAGRAAWLGGVASILHGSNALWAEYFDKNMTGLGKMGFDWRLLDHASQAAWRSFCNS